MGPGSRLALYQRWFVGPGMAYASDVYSTTERPEEQVVVEVIMKQMQFISNIKVVYSGSEFDKPDGYLRDVFGGSSDVNQHYGGE